MVCTTWWACDSEPPAIPSGALLPDIGRLGDGADGRREGGRQLPAKEKGCRLSCCFLANLVACGSEGKDGCDGYNSQKRLAARLHAGGRPCGHILRGLCSRPCLDLSFSSPHLSHLHLVPRGDACYCLFPHGHAILQHLLPPLLIPSTFKTRCSPVVKTLCWPVHVHGLYIC